VDLVRMAVSRVVNNQPLYGRPVPVTHSALVIGGGVAGMSAALKLAGQGYPVHLVEREAELGGNATHIHSTLRNAHVQDTLAAMIARVRSQPLISVHTHTTVKQVSGFVGSFESVLARAGNGSAPGEETIRHGVIILATGAEERQTKQYFYGQDPRVVTQRELEEALAGGTYAPPANGTVVMIQCVESRTLEHPYCSRVCCTQAVKNAITLKERWPGLNVYVLYRDIRTYGTRELAYQRARELGVVFIPYGIVETLEGASKPLLNQVSRAPSNVSTSIERPPVVERRDGRLIVRAWDPVSQTDVVLEADTLALSVGIKPRDDAPVLAAMLKVATNAEKFYLEAHMKLRPVDFATEGIYVAGMAHAPKFIEESIAQASAAVARACTVLAKEQLVSSGLISRVDQIKCVACGDCIKICPYQAITMVNKEVVRRVFKDCAEINPALCKGCGACTAACRSGCITLDGFDDVEIMAQIAALVMD
jgi:heterodisulfide reductase subunit A-like polyferredoxin